MQENKQLTLGVTDGVNARSRIDLAMRRTTDYAVAAYAPVPIGACEAYLRDLSPRGWRGRLDALRRMSGVRAGVEVVPVAAVLALLNRAKVVLSPAALAWLMGNPLWVDQFHNLVTTVGLNDSLTQQFKAVAYTAAWYVGLTDSAPTVAAGDTAASHAGWAESAAYSESVRQTLTLGSVASGSVDNSAAKAVFTINTTVTIGGAFLSTLNTKSGSTGVLYGGGAFSGGDRPLQNLDTLTIGITLTAS